MSTIGFPGGDGGGGGLVAGGLVLLDPVTTLNGTYKDITGIPNDATFVAIALTGISANVNSKQFNLTLGISTGYTNAGTNNNPVLNNAQAATATLNKLILLFRVAGNRWRIWSDDGGGITLNQEASLQAPLERIRIGIHQVANNDAFDNGEISVQYSSERGNPGGTTTDDIPEGSGNVFFTQARARAAVSAAAPLTYNSGTGVFGLDLTAITASQAEAEAGAISSKFTTPLGVSQYHSEQLRTETLTGYARITSGDPSAGEYKVADGTLTFRPKAADVSKTQAIINAGISIEVFDSGGVGLAGTISTFAESSGIYTITLASPYGGTGNFTGAATIRFEGEAANYIRSAVENPATFADLLEDALAVSGNGSKSRSGNVITVTITGGGGGGGSGITTIAAATDTAFANLADGDIMRWVTDDWENAGIEDLVKVSTATANVTLSTAVDSNGVLTLGATATIGAADLPAATASAKGAVIVGDGLSITAQGTLTADVTEQYTLVEGSGATLGGIKTGGNVVMNAGTATISAGSITAEMLAEGVIPSVPVKASKRDVQLGTDDSEFVTPLRLAEQEAGVLGDLTWTGFSYNVDGPDEDTLNSMGEDPNIDYLFQFVTTDAISAAMDARFKQNDVAAVEHDASNKIEGRVRYADRRQVGNTARWVFEFAFKGTPTETGVLSNGDAITLRHQSRLHRELKDENFMESDDISVSGGLTRTIGADGALALSTSMNINDLQNVSGTPTNGQALAYDTSDSMWKPSTIEGGGNVTYATQGTADAGTSTNTVMSPATTHGVLEHLAHVANFTGFTYVTSGNDMGAGTWWINATGTQFRGRGHDAAETQRMLKQFLVDRSCILERSGARLDFDFTAVSSVAQGSNNIVQATITNHRATPLSPTLTGTDWAIRVLPEQNKQILEHAPAGSIPGIALDRGLFQKCVCKMRAPSADLNLTANSSTRFSTTLSASKRMSAIGDSAGEARFTKTSNMTLVPGTITHSTMRAEAGAKYFVRIDGIGVIYCGETAAHGVELGLQFSHKAITSGTWGSWQDCKLEDISETIDGNSVTTYDVSELYGSTGVENVQVDSASGNARLASIFREKRGAGDSNHKDVSPPFWVEFGVGDGELFPLTGRDYRFRFVFAPCSTPNFNELKNLYDYSEILVADRVT